MLIEDEQSIIIELHKVSNGDLVIRQSINGFMNLEIEEAGDYEIRLKHATSEAKNLKMLNNFKSI